MKKYANYIKAISFMSILFLLFIILSFVFMPKDNTKKVGMDEVRAHGLLAEKQNTIDVLVIGDSESYTSLSPMQMYGEQGFTSYDLGVSAQRIYNTYYFFKEAMEYQTPKVVLLETNTLFRKYSAIDAIETDITNSIPFIRYHNRWKKMSFRDLDFEVKYTQKQVNKGFDIRTKVDSVKYRDYMKKTKTPIEVPSYNGYYVKKIRDICEEKGIKLILYSAPSLKNWNYSRHLGMKEFADKNNIEFLDLNLVKEIKIDWENETYDKGDHVNYYGAVKVSSYMSEYLAKTYNLVDHRNDAEYESWNEDLESYYEEVLEKTKEK